MGFGFFNQSIVGWDRNTYAPITYLSGSFFARGVQTTFTQGSTSFCGGMYSFGVYTFGLPSGRSSWRVQRPGRLCDRKAER